AFAVVAAAVWLIRAAWEEDRRFKISAGVLGALLAAQLVLGVESWLMRFGGGVLPELQRVTVASGMVLTLHFGFVSLVFGTRVVLARLACRRPAEAVARRSVPLEGAA